MSAIDMSKEAMKLALEALEWEEAQTAYPSRMMTNAITALREALALVNEVDQEQPAPATELREQEPVAWYRDEDGIRIYYESKVWDNATPLYTSPPTLSLAQRQRSVKPLTIKQEQKAFEKWWIKEIGYKDDLCSSNVPKFTPTFYAITRVEYAWLAWQARAIEAKLKEKNSD